MPRYVLLLPLLLLISATLSPASGEDLTADQTSELARIRAEIARQDLSWRAGDNPTFRLPAAERTRRNGSPAPSDWQGPLPRDRRGLPLLIDWRDNGGNWVTPVRDQESCGSCWVFSAVAAFESWVMLNSGAPIPTLDLSEQYVLSCVDVGGCNGGWCQNALGFLTTEGACDEACFPYLSDDSIPCGDACNDVLERLVYLGDHEQITFGTIDVDAINTALQDGPVITNFAIYEDFYAYTEGIYIWDGVSAADGGHSVIVIGYDDGRQAWLAKNSWGTRFGEFGYFWIAYDSGTGFGSETWQARDLNQRPQLRDAGCAPEVASPGAMVTWSVTYRDPEGDVPLAATLTLLDPGGRTDIYPLSAGDGDLVDGVPYSADLVLTEMGQYGTRFRFYNEAGQEVFWPASGFADLPVVDPVSAGPRQIRTTLRAPAPNPANPGCTIAFHLASPGDVDLAVYDLSGKRVRTLIRGWRGAGEHREIWHGRDASGGAVPSGTYLVQMRAGGHVEAHKISLVQ